MRQVRLHHADAAGTQHVLEFETREHALAGGQRNGGAGGQARVVLGLFGQHRLFDEQRLERLEFAQQRLGHRRADAAVEVDAEVDGVAEGFADFGHLDHRSVDRARAVDQLHFFGAVELEGVETQRAVVGDLLDDRARAVAADPAIGLHAVAHQPAQQLVYRHAQRLALDVPQRLVDTGDRAHQDGAATVETGAVHGLPQVVDARRILADDIAGQFVYGGLHRTGAAFDNRLSPTGNALVGFDLEEQPARRSVVGGEAGDLHPCSSW